MFGDFSEPIKLSLSRHRSAGLPAGMDLMRYERVQSPDIWSDYTQGHTWEQFRASDADAAARVQRSATCVMLRGSPEVDDTLDYLRDIVGVIAALVDIGIVAVHDLLRPEWWAGADWLARFHAHGEVRPLDHVFIYRSDDDQPGRWWYHTRGMLKFGRPDLSVRGVPDGFEKPVVELIQRFIVLQAEGGVIAEGQEIRMAGLPSGMTCRHGGSHDDLDFNNVHVGIDWPLGV